MATVLLDNGSHSLKVGLAGEYARLLPNYGLRVMDSDVPLYGAYLSGLPLITKAYKLVVCKKGEICDWALEEAIWRDALQTLYQDSECDLSNRLHSLLPDCNEINLVTTTSIDAHPAAKRHFLEYCFERMQFASVAVQPPESYIARHSLLCEATTGIILEMGYSGISATAFIYRNPITYSRTFVEGGGAMLDDAFVDFVGEASSSRLFNGLRKRRLLIEPLRQCFFALSENTSLKVVFNPEKMNYEVQAIPSLSPQPLPAGREDRDIMRINNCQEITQRLLEKVAAGIPNIVSVCLQTLPVELQAPMKQNVFLCGGLANIGAFVEIVKDVLLTSNIADDIQVLPDPQNAVYNGMQLYADSTEYLRSRITKELYDEYGSSGLSYN